MTSSILEAIQFSEKEFVSETHVQLIWYEHFLSIGGEVGFKLGLR